MALFSVLAASPAALSSSRLPSSIHRNTCSSTARAPRAAPSRRRVSSSVRCEQGAKQAGAGAGVWLGRAAMIGFASVIAVEVSTGIGFLENFGVSTPAPTLALAVSGLVVGLAVFFLLQSGSQD